MSVQSGFVKIQNVDLPYGRQLIPELLFMGSRVWRPCSLPATMVHKFSAEHIIARIGFESEMNRPCWINIDTTKHQCHYRYSDKSALYECSVEGAEALQAELSFKHENYYLRLYHHTSRDILPKILDSQQLRASKWNYEGTTEHETTNFIYLTELPELRNPGDFFRVAMSAGGVQIALGYDQPSLGVEILDVPRRAQRSADAALELLVQPDVIELQSMLYHDQTIRNEGVARYWELLHQNIFRIPADPGGYISVYKQKQPVSPKNVEGLKLRNTVLAGCAFKKGQIRVVYDENDHYEYKVMSSAGKHIDPLERFLRDV